MTPRRVKRKSKNSERRNRSKQFPGGRKPSVRASLGLFFGIVIVSTIAVIGVPYPNPQGEDVLSEDVNRNIGQVEVWSGDRVRVEVQNGGGVTGMARTATDVLRTAGFDVVKFGNARTFDPERSSVVIDRVGRYEAADAISKTLGIDSVLSEPDPNLYVDVTVVLGSPWQPLTPVLRSEVTEPWSWWDPREWFGP
ncbi:MAG TPA: hypothetical protein DEF01_02290 [Gemmatimonadetes bacterium]|nr:hypothetical protein [Gemmatimonadota bacterium]